jgi:membrane fusion protein, multidrug efflux system
MNIKKSLPWITLLVVVAVAGGWFYRHRQPAPAAPAAASSTPPSPVSVINGVTVIAMDPGAQAQNGIQTTPLAATHVAAAITAYGTVLDLQPLLDLRSRYTTALADAKTAAASAVASRQEYARNRILYQDNQNVSLKAFQTAQAAYLADRAKAQAAALNVENLQGAARQQFGEPLGRWATTPNSSQFQRLASRQAVLLRITLPLGSDATAPQTIQVEAGGPQQLPATLLSSSPQSDPNIQGRAWLYTVNAPLAAGTRVVAYLPSANQPSQGLLIPASAIVWYGGQPWGYVQTDPGHFARRLVPQQAPSNGGFFVTSGFQPGVRVVTSGAELLLSEEQKPAPNSGTGCKDPECDD